jgi:hypothetical protein
MPEQDYGTVNARHKNNSSASLHGEPPKNMADEETGRSESDPLISSSDNGADRPPEMSPVRAYFTIATLTVLTLVGSMSTGVLNISIPRIQEDLQLPEEFVLW